MSNFDMKTAALVTSGLTDNTLVVGAKTGQIDADPDPITLLALWAYINGKISLSALAGTLGLTQVAAIADQNLLGNISGGAASPQALTAAQARTLLNVADGANNYVHPNHTGDVTSVADGATTIAANAVTNAKLADMATATIKGRTTAGSGDPEDLTAAQATALLAALIGDSGSGGTKGLAPAPAAGDAAAGKFLKADGTWATPAGGGGGGGGGAPMLTKVESNRYIAPPIFALDGSAALVLNNLYVAPVFIAKGGTVTVIGVDVTTGVAGNCRLGIYNNANGRPSTLVLDAGTVDVSTTGIKEITISQALSDNTWYWLAIAPGVSTPQVRGGRLGTLIGYEPSIPHYLYRLQRGFTYGALPADESAASYSIAAGVTVPILHLRG